MTSPENSDAASPDAARPDAGADPDADDVATVASLRGAIIGRLLDAQSPYSLVRFVLLRLLALVYFVAFLVAMRQGVALIGEHGILPTPLFLQRVLDATDSHLEAYIRLPTLFWFHFSDGALLAVSWIGAALSLAVLFGLTNAAAQFALWLLYLSIVQIGQRFYGYGWESQLLETGFLSIFLCPLRTVRPFVTPPPFITIVLFRWLIARIMLGAGLIKIRGDECWRDLTCLIYHYETQPNPNPLSPAFHFMPAFSHRIGVAFNHVVELGAPWFAFGPRRARLIAGSLFIAFQTTLILSGNLSFLNWLTIVPALACFDDDAVRRWIPARWRTKVPTVDGVPSRFHQRAAWAYAFIVGVLSINPVTNMISSRQAMNLSFDPLHLVNTYGAFGSVTRKRYEVVVEGTRDAQIGPDTKWLEYEFFCKPGDVTRSPCWISPYHYRLDWQMWFLPFDAESVDPWFLHFVYKLLKGDEATLHLLAKNPFGRIPPRWIRAEFFHYEMEPPGSRNVWRRRRAGTYLRPVSRDDPELMQLVRYFERRASASFCGEDFL